MEESKKFKDIMDELDRDVVEDKGVTVENMLLKIDIPKLEDLEVNPYAN